MKKQRSDWLARTRAQRLIQLTNIKDKITPYKSILPLDGTKIDRIILVCETIIAVMTFTDQTRATAQQVTGYEDLVMTADGGVRGAPVPPVPTFGTLSMPAGAFIGAIPELRDLVEDIKGADNYTDAIGEDLMILPPEGADLVEADIVAEAKVAPLAGTYGVRIEGSLQGMSAMRVDWRPKGATVWQIGAGFLTKLPGEITITPAAAGEPESGELRCVLIENNKPVGQFSPNYPVTVS